MWLWDSIIDRRRVQDQHLYGAASAVSLADLIEASSFDGRLHELNGRSILLTVHDQLAAAVALIELDGVARRVVLCPPDAIKKHFARICNDAAVDAWIGDPDQFSEIDLDVELRISPRPSASTPVTRNCYRETQWILLTSGTTGAPKSVLHTLGSLTNAFSSRKPTGNATWGTFYDIRRYGGLQIFLRALQAGSLVLSSGTETIGEFMGRLRGSSATYVSGTPTHWRKALMSGAASEIDPTYVRLSGEIVDQAILDALRVAFPKATVAHAFASTEAGVGFEVRDGLSGFPASLLDASDVLMEMKISNGTLRLRSGGNATCYLGRDVPRLKETDGFIDTGDQLELRHGRYYFLGRSGGVVNVGGLKVHPEEVESVINCHPRVRMSRVAPRRSPITGAVVVADVVLVGDVNAAAIPWSEQEQLKREINESCRDRLAAHKVPAIIRFVQSLEVSDSGKLSRANP